MRKSSKLLAVLLTLCLLFGAITAIFVSAEEGEKSPYKVVDNAAHYYSADPISISATGKTHVYETYDEAKDLNQFEYMTVDFDLSADEYPSVMNFVPMISAGTDRTQGGDLGTGDKFYSYMYLSTNAVETKPGTYITGNSKTEATLTDNRKLNTEQGATNHLTVVYKFTKTDGVITSYTQYFFINGENSGLSNQKISTATNSTASRTIEGCNDFMFGGIYVNKLSGGTNVTLSNLSVNCYTANDPSLGDFDSTSGPALYTSDDVVYNIEYPIPGATNYVQVGDAKTYIPAAASTLIAKKLEDKGTITVKGMNLTDVTIPAGITEFTVIKDGGSFALSEESNYLEKSVTGGTLYYLPRVTDYNKGDASYSSGSFSSKVNGNVNKTITSTGKNNYEAEYDFSNFKYATVDFDFAFTSDDFYTMEFRTSISRTSGKTDGASYDTSTDYVAVSNCKITKTGDDYYMGTVKLSNEKNVYDHFTVLFAFETVDGTFTVRSYMYVNGELAFSDSEDYEDTNTQHQVARLQIRNASEATATAKNIYVNLYKDSDSENGIASIVGTDKPLYTANDVVYDAAYVPDGAKWDETDTYAEVDNYRYFVVGAAFNNAIEGGTVYLNNVVGEYTLPKNFLNLTVVDKTGTFSPSAADEAMYNISEDGNVYTYELKNYAKIGEVPYADIDKAFLALEEGGTITIVGTVADYTLPKILESFTVEGDFTLCEEQLALYDVDGNTYTIKAYAMIGDDTYYNINEAFLALKDGETVTIVGTVENYTLPADMTARNFTVELNNEDEGAFSLSEESAANYNVADGVYEYNKYAEIHDVRYYDDDYVDAFAELGHDGDDIILSNIAVEGFVAKAADYNTFSVILKNGATFTLDYFKSDAYCATVVDEETTTYTNVFAREQLMASVSLFSSDVKFKLYLPKLEGLTFTPEANIAMSVDLVYDKVYGGYTAVWNPPVWHNASERLATITGTYVNGETEGTVTIASKLSITGYATKVIENTTQYPCGGEAQQVVRAMIEYKLAVATYKPADESTSFKQSTKETHINSLTTFLAKYNTLHSDCQCGTVVAEGTHIKVGTVADPKPENLLSDVCGVTFGFAGTNQGYYLILTGVESETAPTISYIGHKGNSRTPITASLEEMATAGNYSYEFAASDLDNEFTVTINDVEYVYSLAYYLDAANTALEDAQAKVAEGDESAATDVTTWTEAIAQANALAKYALAAENFKVSPVTEQ